MSPSRQLNPVSVLIAALFLSLFGFVWFGIIFRDLQMTSHGYTEMDYADNSPLWYLGGLAISAAIAVGLAVMVRLRGRPGLAGGCEAGFLAALCFGIPLVSYPFVFSPGHEVGLFVTGVAHIVIGWTVGGGIIGLAKDPAPSA